MAKVQAEPKPRQASPKQLALVGVLTVVLLTVGVVQFGKLPSRGGGSSSAQPQPPSVAKSTAESATSPPIAQLLPPLAPRDPFRPTIAVAQPAPSANPPTRTSKPPSPRPRREITGAIPTPPMTLPMGQLELQPTMELPAKPEYPNYTLTGVVQGPNSVAILVDNAGRRRFVRSGDLLESGWRVQSIQRGVITLQKGKQRLTVCVGQTTTPNGGDKE
ncbi:MAG: hypothetical protein RMJ83_00170 [Armatimonadota bacterium]|nr:hypothetical protein [Armatimonadota bacterium]